MRNCQLEDKATRRQVKIDSNWQIHRYNLRQQRLSIFQILLLGPRTCSAHALNTRANFCALIMRRVIRSKPGAPTPRSLLPRPDTISKSYQYSNEAASLRASPPALQPLLAVRFVLIARAFCSEIYGPESL